MERVTGIEPASRAWEPSNGALVQALTAQPRAHPGVEARSRVFPLVQPDRPLSAAPWCRFYYSTEDYADSGARLRPREVAGALAAKLRRTVVVTRQSRPQQVRVTPALAAAVASASQTWV